MSLAALRAEQVGKLKLAVDQLSLPSHWLERERMLCLSPGASSRLREALAGQGMELEPADSGSHSAGFSAGWHCSDATRTAGRRDLIESIGAGILETMDGLPPALPDALDFTGPVDLVYTWVDGTDQQWRADRAAALGAGGAPFLPTAADDARFTSNDELRFSLRSVEAFLPWVNHIYVVTAQAPPAWLDQSRPGITVVRHEEIFADRRDLPTFNSHAIESMIHRIPGLSEHFIYVNDDVMFGRPLSPNLFFTPAGQTRFQLSANRFESHGDADLPINVAARNNAALLRESFGMASSLKFKHVAHPQRRSVLERIEAEHPVEVARTAAARFRSSTDLSIPAALAHYYGAALGLAVEGQVDYKYVDLGSENAQMELARLFWNRRPQMFCLNQVSGRGDALARQHDTVSHFLRHAFPWPSSFELA